MNCTWERRIGTIGACRAISEEFGLVVPSIKRRLSEQVEQIKQVTCLVEVVCAEPGVAR